MTLRFSYRLAIVFGILVPVLEVIRRWRQISDPAMFPFWFDDFLLGAFLLYGARLVSKGAAHGRLMLAAAWGFTCGMAYPSFFVQLAALDQPDPGPVPTAWVVTLKGIGFCLAIAALFGALRRPEESVRG